MIQLGTKNAHYNFNSDNRCILQHNTKNPVQTLAINDASTLIASSNYTDSGAELVIRHKEESGAWKIISIVELPVTPHILQFHSSDSPYSQTRLIAVYHYQNQAHVKIWELSDNNDTTKEIHKFTLDKPVQVSAMTIFHSDYMFFDTDHMLHVFRNYDNTISTVSHNFEYSVNDYVCSSISSEFGLIGPEYKLCFQGESHPVEQYFEQGNVIIGINEKSLIIVDKHNKHYSIDTNKLRALIHMHSKTDLAYNVHLNLYAQALVQAHKNGHEG